MDIIHFLQSFQSEGVTIFFKLVTLLGNKEFYIIVLPLFFWLWDRDKAARLVLVLLPSVLLNFYFKEIFQTARPEGVALITQGGFSFPSGHAQGSATLWLMLALMTRQKWMTILAGIMIALVSLSRLYLGVHYPIDVFGGCLIGVVLVLIYNNYLFDALKRAISTQTKTTRAAVLTVIVLLLTIIYPAHEAITLLAVQWGFAMMLIFSSATHRLPPKGILLKLLMVIAGTTVVLLIWKGLKVILPPGEITRFLRYAFIGIWTATLPLLMTRRNKSTP